MNIGFSQFFPKEKKGLDGRETRFVEKILQGLLENELACFEVLKRFYKEAKEDKIIKDSDDKIHSKIHTIRKNNRFKPGMKIDFFVGLRTKNCFRFAPRQPFVSSQQISIIHHWNGYAHVLIDNKVYWGGLKTKNEFENTITQLALNDGFDNVKDFFNWFDEDFDGFIIHWTNKKY